MRVDLNQQRTERSFQSLFCEEIDCLAQDYAVQAFWRFLPWHTKAIAFLIHQLSPNFFVEDFQFIHALGQTKNPMAVITTALEFRDSKRRRSLRHWLGVAVSEKKAAKLARQYFTRHQL